MEPGVGFVWPWSKSRSRPNSLADILAKIGLREMTKRGPGLVSDATRTGPRRARGNERPRHGGRAEDRGGAWALALSRRGPSPGPDPIFLRRFRRGWDLGK